MTDLISVDENIFYSEIRTILQSARQKSYSKVNSIMVEAYWQIGKRIVEQEQLGNKRADYGSYLVKNLSKKLGNEFGKGFSVANLWNFRQFYLVFPDKKILYTLCRGLSWSHIRLIMRQDEQKEREYYLNEVRLQNWSVRQLERNIRTGYFHRILTSKSVKKEDKVINPLQLEFIKDPYVFEFLGLPENREYGESTLEQAIINNLQKFLLEMGNGFSFVGRQFRISTETSHFYIDLVFYNYLLKCFVVIDLKTKKLTHQDIGQMDMYVRMFDNLKRREDDNPTIGISLCADKDETVVKYSVLKESEQLFASKNKTVLPTEEELKRELEYEAHIAEKMLAGDGNE